MNLYRTITILLIAILFTVGSFPAAGLAFPGSAHWIAHLTAYTLISLFFGLGWPDSRAVLIALMVAGIGLFHELSEIVTHSHGFETNDVFINTSGALIGILILSIIRGFRLKN